MISAERKDGLVNFCREMIRRPSLSGHEENVAEYVAGGMKRLGFDGIDVDDFGNVVGRMIFGRGGRKILLEGHMDHVDIGDPSKWHYDPFGAEIADGKIYGRGTSDMKGNLSAMIFAASFLKEDCGDRLNGEILVAGSVHEECFEGIASQSIGETYAPDFVVIGEASGLTLKRGQRGRAEVVLETIGKTAHSSDPSVGLNAVKKMVEILYTIEGYFVPPHDEILGDGILEVTDIISSPYPGASVVPDKCTATFDRRLLVGETEENVLKQIEKVIDVAKRRDRDIEASLSLAVGEDKCYTGKPIKAVRFAPGWLLSENHPFVRTALSGLGKVGQNPELSHYAFCTNGSYYAGKAGIPTVGYGGSLESLAHVDDEYIEMDQLVKACAGYYGIVRAVLDGTEGL